MRDEVKKRLLDSKREHVVCELPTGMGKTHLALSYAVERGYKRVLILIPKLVLIDNWKDEIGKWGFEQHLIPSFSTYVSMEKQDFNKYDLVIADEAHRISDNNKTFLERNRPKRMLLLSATIPYDTKRWIQTTFNAQFITVSLSEAMDNDVLPTPKIELIPLHIEQIKGQFLWFRGKGKPVRTVSHDLLSKYRYSKDTAIVCNAKQYLDLIESTIEYFNGRKNEAQQLRFAYLRACKDRLEFLSKIKAPIVKQMLDIKHDERVIVFAPDIKSSKEVCKNSINSKDGNASKVLTDFNEGKLTHISSCRMLDEGINLVDCKSAVFMALAATEVTQVQRIGRVLRHKEPVVYIPYFLGTREERIVQQINSKL